MPHAPTDWVLFILFLFFCLFNKIAFSQVHTLAFTASHTPHIMHNAYRCVISWQTYLKGSDPAVFRILPATSHLRLPILPTLPTTESKLTQEQDQVCVNPLDWVTGAGQGDEQGKQMPKAHGESPITTPAQPGVGNSGEYRRPSHNLGSKLILNYYQILLYLTGSGSDVIGSGNNGASDYSNFLNKKHEGESSRQESRRKLQNSRIIAGAMPLASYLLGSQCTNGSLFIDRPYFSSFFKGHYDFLGSVKTFDFKALCAACFYGIFPSWNFALFPGSNYHAYDYHLFWMNIRLNVKDRVAAYYVDSMLM